MFFISILLPLLDIIDDGNFNFVLHISFTTLYMYIELLLIVLITLMFISHIEYLILYIFFNNFKIIVNYLFCFYLLLIKLIINFKQILSYVINYIRKIIFLQTSQATLPFI